MTAVLLLHNIMRWVVLLTALLTIVSAIAGMGGKKVFGAGDKRNALFFMISCDIQLLLGIYLYFSRGWFNVLTSGTAMTSSYNRFYSVEHMAGMLVALVFVHIGYAATKKSMPDAKKFKRLLVFSLLAVAIILATIPWPGRAIIGRPLLPGMPV